MTLYTFDRNYLGSQGIIINTAPISHVPARAMPKPIPAVARASIADGKSDGTKPEEKMASRSSRSKTKGADEQEAALVEEPIDIAPTASSKRSGGTRSSEPSNNPGRSSRSKEDLKTSESAVVKRG